MGSSVTPGVETSNTGDIYVFVTGTISIYLLPLFTHHLLGGSNLLLQFYKQKNKNSPSDQYHNSKEKIVTYAMLLSPLGLFYVFFRFNFVFFAEPHGL